MTEDDQSGIWVGDNYIRESKLARVHRQESGRVPDELLSKFEEAEARLRFEHVESRRARRSYFWNVIFPVAIFWAICIGAIIWDFRYHFLWSSK
jgi:hypothetical protein